MLGKIFKKKPMALRIGDTAPDFKAETTTGDISFHDWRGSSRKVRNKRDGEIPRQKKVGQSERLQENWDTR